METILSTAFGHKAEILRGRAENDQLYKAASEYAHSLKSGGSVGLFITLAIQCKLLEYLLYLNTL